MTNYQILKIVKTYTINYSNKTNVSAVIFKPLLYRAKVCDSLHETLFIVKYETFHKVLKIFLTVINFPSHSQHNFC